MYDQNLHLKLYLQFQLSIHVILRKYFEGMESLEE